MVAAGKSAREFLEHTRQRVDAEGERAQDVLLGAAVAPIKNTTLLSLVTERLQWLAKDGEFDVRIYTEREILNHSNSSEISSR